MYKGITDIRIKIISVVVLFQILNLLKITYSGKIRNYCFLLAMRPAKYTNLIFGNLSNFQNKIMKILYLSK